MSEFEPETGEKKKKLSSYRIIMIILAVAIIGIGIWQIIQGVNKI